MAINPIKSTVNTLETPTLPEFNWHMPSPLAEILRQDFISLEKCQKLFPKIILTVYHMALCWYLIQRLLLFKRIFLLITENSYFPEHKRHVHSRGQVSFGVSNNSPCFLQLFLKECFKYFTFALLNYIFVSFSYGFQHFSYQLEWVYIQIGS